MAMTFQKRKAQQQLCQAEAPLESLPARWTAETLVEMLSGH